MNVFIEITEFSTGKVVRTMPVDGATSRNDSIVERAERGLLRQIDTERFGFKAVERAAA